MGKVYITPLNYYLSRQWRLRHSAVVYEILNTKNNFRYIGATFWFKQRKADHMTSLKRNVHANKNLQADWNKYGKQNFQFNILSKCKTLRIALVEERKTIQHSDSLYNVIRYKQSHLLIS